MKTGTYTELLVLLFAGLILFFIAFPLDRFSGSLPGHLLGIVGALSMSATLAYPFRKRVRGKKGKANPLQPHVYFGLIGAILVTLHAAGRSSTIGMLVYLAVFLVVASGVVGRILLAKVNRSLRDHKNEAALLRSAFGDLKTQIDPRLCYRYLILEEETLIPENGGGELDQGAARPVLLDRCLEFHRLAEAIAVKEDIIQAYARTQFLFRFWNRVHIMLSFVLFAMIGVHVLSTLYYGLRWLP